MFQPAEQPDVVRALQKDEYHLNSLTEDAREIASSFLGRHSARYESEVQLLSSLAYYGTQTLLGRQTLGEEYCDIATLAVRPAVYRRRPNKQQQQADSAAAAVAAAQTHTDDHATTPPTPQSSSSSSHASARPVAARRRQSQSQSRRVYQHRPAGLVLPSARRRYVFIVLQCLLPYALAKTRKFGRRIPRPGPGEKRSLPWRVYRRCWNSWMELVSLARVLPDDATWRQTIVHAILANLQRFHLALFYLFGAYLEVPRRIAGLRHVFLSRQGMERPGYQTLGLLIMLQMVIQALRGARATVTRKRQAAHQARQAREQRQQMQQQLDDSSSSDEDEDAVNCTLCLCPRTETAATECGHLFCWGCISDCLTSKPECPVCRHAPCLPNKLVLLAHYS